MISRSLARGESVRTSNAKAKAARVRFCIIALATSAALLLPALRSQAQSESNPLGVIFGAGQKTLPWQDLLDSLEDSTPQKSIAELTSFRSRPFANQTEKQEAAYVLGRLLYANPALANLDQTQTSAATPAPSNALSSATTSGAFAQARALFEESAGLSSLHRNSLTHAIECATAAKDEEAVQRLLKQEIAEGAKQKDSSQTVGHEYALAQSYLRAQDYATALPIFTKIRAGLPDSNFSYGACYYLADACLTGHNENMTATEAIECFRTYLQRNPDGHFAREIVSRLKDLSAQAALSPPYVPTPADHELFGQVYFGQGDSRSALSEWEQAPPGTKLSQRAVCLARLGRITQAKEILLAAIASKPSTSYATAANAITQSLTREDTRQFFVEILKAKPEKTDTALWNVGVRSEPPQSVGCFKRLIAGYPTSEFAPEATWWLFWNFAKRAPKDAGAASAALAIARQGLKQYPETRAGERLAFWSGKLYELEKKSADASNSYRYTISHFSSSYYAHRARARLGTMATGPTARSGSVLAAVKRKSDPGWTTHPNRLDAVDSWDWPAPEKILTPKEISTQCGATTAELYKLRQLDECIDSIPNGSEPAFKAALLAKNGRPLTAINTDKAACTGLVHDSLSWQMAYPLVYAQTVKSESAAKGVDPFLVHALIREESRYYHLAVSRSHALGLMQLLPGTAYGVAKRLGVPISTQDDFFRPNINIKLGTDYLSYVLGRYSGNALCAVASYNGGPNAVKTWLRTHEESGIADMDYFVENIPVRETRDYVRKVFGSYWNYLAIYTEPHA